MDPARRYEVFAAVDVGVLERWAEAVVAASDVRVLKPSSHELVMMEALDPTTDASFFLGEVLIQECRVVVGDTAGYGYALEDASRALCSAILDGALSGGHPLCPAICRELEAAADSARRRLASESQLLERTRVNFEKLEG